ncbi:hypothetical protein NMG60_11003119 [Bertholletia excelsa]
MPQLRKGPWTIAEDAMLTEHVRKNGEGNWNSIQDNTRLLRCGKSCRLRWVNHLRPNLKKGPFSADEESLIIEFHSKHGNKWARMASLLPGRTDNKIKNFWNTRIKGTQKATLPVYPTNVLYPNNHLQRRQPYDVYSRFSPYSISCGHCNYPTLPGLTQHRGGSFLSAYSSSPKHSSSGDRSSGFSGEVTSFNLLVSGATPEPTAQSVAGNDVIAPPEQTEGSFNSLGEVIVSATHFPAFHPTLAESEADIGIQGDNTVLLEAILSQTSVIGDSQTRPGADNAAAEEVTNGGGMVEVHGSAVEDVAGTGGEGSAPGQPSNGRGNFPLKKMALEYDEYIFSGLSMDLPITPLPSGPNWYYASSSSSNGHLPEFDDDMTFDFYSSLPECFWNNSSLCDYDKNTAFSK